MAAMCQLYQKRYTPAEKQHSEDLTEGDALADKRAAVQQEHLRQLPAMDVQQQQPQQRTQRRVGRWQQIFGTAPSGHPELNTAETSQLQVALMQQ
ncbi:TPA: hypothetical protein ACH3X1_001872 [Trebouxia sp. C0004]